MAITTTWQIDWMSVSSNVIASQLEVVLTAQWRCIGNDGANELYIVGVCSFPEPTTGSTFTPYAQLTQDEVLSWCYANGVNQIEIEASVTQNLIDLENPPIAQPPLPWA